MNDSDHLELQQLKVRQMRLQKELATLSDELARFDARINESRHPVLEQQVEPLALEGVLPSPPELLVPPVISPARPDFSPQRTTPVFVPPPPPSRAPAPASKFAKGLCSYCLGQLDFPQQIEGSKITCPHCGEQTVLSAGPIRVEVPVAAMKVEPAPAEIPIPVAMPIPPVAVMKETEPEQSFEMRLGTYWLVRIGIVMVLTALVFFGNLAYHNFIAKLGPSGKVGLLYVASFGLLGAGAWWQRKAVKESLRNYAQVLFAGGLAGVYFTTYAAHHFPNLMVIPNPTVDGLLLLGWAGFMTWIADRKKSEVLAFFAVGLAYYTSVITRVGHFTLYSNLVLTAVAVAFLVRNRWAKLSFASLAATYGAYAYWHFFDSGAWHWTSGTANTALGVGGWFLIGYWALFTAGVFLSRDEGFANETRGMFLSANNGAFVGLFLLTMLQSHEGGFWKFFLVSGLVFLGLAAAIRQVLPQEPVPKQAYLIQGLLLVTIGLITKYSGLQLALLLGAESIVLLFLGQAKKNTILQGASYIVAALAMGWAMDGLEHFDRRSLYMGIGLGTMMVANMVLAGRQASPSQVVRAGPAYFSGLALLIWFLVTWHNSRPEWFPVVLGLECLALSMSVYLLRGRELALFSQIFLLVGQVYWMFNSVHPGQPTAWWPPLLLIVITVVLSHWWPRQKAIQLQIEFTGFVQAVYALALMGLIYFWLAPKFQPATWLALTSGLALCLTLYGLFTRAWWIAAFSQLFLFVSVGHFFLQFAGKPVPPAYALVPIAVTGLFSWATVSWFKSGKPSSPGVKESLTQLAMAYRWCALVMSLIWIYQHIPELHRVWVLSAVGLLVFAWSGVGQSREGLLFSVPYSAAAMVSFWEPLMAGAEVRWLSLFLVVALVAQQRMARRIPERFRFEPLGHAILVAAAGVSLWMFITRLVMQSMSGFYLTASWSVFALCIFGLGIILRERSYRWLGLAVLGAALGRVVIFDVWKLETIYRMLSFLALGMVLLVLGFIYNKYQEKIREWL
jgi:uncharacterized membrane protein